MRTTKPISTISFNTASYLRLKLDELKKAKIISVWHYIEHLPEDDEAGKKKHIHLYIEPSKLLQTEELEEHFKELDMSMPDKPKKCLPFRSSKFADWYLYSLHDTAYLVSKGQTRRYKYEHSDFVTSDADELYRASKMIDRRSLTPWVDLAEAVQDGLTFAEYFQNSGQPIQQINAFHKAFELLCENNTYRAGRQTHSPKHSPRAIFDIETGEIIKGIEKRLETRKKFALSPVIDGKEIREVSEIFNKQNKGELENENN